MTLDKKLMREIGIEYNDWVWVEPDRQGKRIIIRKRRDNEW